MPSALSMLHHVCVDYMSFVSPAFASHYSSWGEKIETMNPIFKTTEGSQLASME